MASMGYGGADCISIVVITRPYICTFSKIQCCILLLRLSIANYYHRRLGSSVHSDRQTDTETQNHKFVRD